MRQKHLVRMGMIKTIAKNTFRKIFKNLALDEELNCPVEEVQIVISFENGEHRYDVYKNFKRVKQIQLDNYVGAVVDFTGGTSVIETTIAQSGAKYAKECNGRVDDISIVMRNKVDGLPDCALMNGSSRVRKIDIENEFLN